MSAAALLVPQPPPVPAEGDLWAEVIADCADLGTDNDGIDAGLLDDMRARRAFGIDHYGTPLQVGNGREMEADAYQELLDGIVYLYGAAQKREAAGETDAADELHAIYEEAVALAGRVRAVRS